MTTAPFEIKVVYDAAQRKRRGAVVRSSSVRTVGTTARALLIGALLNLTIAGAMYYATWWRIDPYIYITLLTRTPMDVSKEFAANPFGITTLPNPPASQEERVEGVEPTSPSGEERRSTPRWQGKTAQVLIPATAYGWLVLATASVCAVALTGGAWLGVAGGTGARVLGVFGMLVLIVGVSYFGYRVWTQSQWMFKPDQLRLGMGFLTLLLALIGLASAGRARGITKFAGVVVIIAAIGTAAALWLWVQTGALDLQYGDWSNLGAAFGIHAAWGLVLLLSANRIRA